MTERLTTEQQAQWDRWIARALPYLSEGFSSSVADTLLVAVDAELRALRAELAEARKALIVADELYWLGLERGPDARLGTKAVATKFGELRRALDLEEAT